MTRLISRATSLFLMLAVCFCNQSCTRESPDWVVVQKALAESLSRTGGFQKLEDGSYEENIDLFITSENWFVAIISKKNAEGGLYNIPIGFIEDGALTYRTIGSFYHQLDSSSILEYDNMLIQDSLWKLINVDSPFLSTGRIKMVYMLKTFRVEDAYGYTIREGKIFLPSEEPEN